MKTGTCRLCNQLKQLVRAHIIPRSFTLRVRGQSKQLIEAREHDTRDVQYWQNGVWDDEILCEGCEKTFQAWDDYGFQLLGKPPGNDALPRDDSEVQSFVIKNIDYARLKLFVLSVLWRSSVSSQPFFARVKLGRHESLIAQMIRNQNAGSYDEFPVVLARLVGQPLPSTTYAPYRQRSPEGVNFNILFLPSIKMMVKVDRRTLPQILEPVVLKPQSENVVVSMLLHANELRTLRESAEIFRRWRSRP